MTICFEEEVSVDFDFDYKDIIKKVIDKACDYENCPYDIEVNVLLTDNENIKDINKEQRNIDKATDVLSFPANEFDIPGRFEEYEDNLWFNPESGELLLGDIVISVDKVKEQADLYGHSKLREIAFLTAHSMLHLFGYDHMEEDERVVMEEKQNEILNFLGITRD